MTAYIITAILSAAVGAAVAWSLAFDMGWDAAYLQHEGKLAGARSIGIEEGRAAVLAEVHFARSEAATRAAQTRAERRAADRERAILFGDATSDDVPTGVLHVSDSEQVSASVDAEAA